MTKITEIYDMLCDLNFPIGDDGLQKNRADYITGGIPNTIYTGGRVNYNSNTSKWTIQVPKTNFEFTHVSFKCFSPIPLAAYSNDKECFVCCNLSPNTNKRIMFGLTNLTSGVEIAPLNNNLEIEIWFWNPIQQRLFDINTISNYFYNLVLNLDFIVRN